MKDWNDERFIKISKVHPISINLWMIISYKGVEYIKWASSAIWINGYYYRQNRY
jgi:hypothetical protein